MIEIKGDLFKEINNGRYDVLVHGCNCFNSFISDTAKRIKAIYPQAYEADKNTVKNDRGKLGGFSAGTILCNNNPLLIVNAYTHFHYLKQYSQLDYVALNMVCKKIANRFSNVERIIMPNLGDGFGNGEWEDVKPIIMKYLYRHDVTVVL